MFLLNSPQNWLNLALDFKSASPSVYFGDVKNGDKATVTVTVSDNDFLDIASGKLNPQKVRRFRISWIWL